MSFLDKIRAFFDFDGPLKPSMIVKVHKGDSLWKIAESITGQGSRWHELADANPGRWDDDDSAHVIHPGEELKLPDSWVTN